jgi:hypothetical protein
MHQGIHNHNTCSIYGGERKLDQDLESGLVIFDKAMREKQSLCFISMRREQTKAMAQPMLTQMHPIAALTHVGE